MSHSSVTTVEEDHGPRRTSVPLSDTIVRPYSFLPMLVLGVVIGFVVLGIGSLLMPLLP